MNSGSPLPADQSGGATPPLPELNLTLLDLEQAGQLLRDIEECATILAIIPKFAARGQVPDDAGITLARAREMLTQRTVRGLQLRYRHDNAEWWDTLMLHGDQFRLVRIRHDFAAA